LWTNVEDAWCVDAALRLSQPTPAATLMLSSAVGDGHISGLTGLVGGSGYSPATTFSISDTNGGEGSGATLTGTIIGGVITALTLLTAGSGYQFPVITAYDPAGSAGGSGFSAQAFLANRAIASTNVATFIPGDTGSFIRAGGGIARITAYIDAQHVQINIFNSFPVVPNTGGEAQVFVAGNWTMTAPVATISGLNHLIGQTVTGLADGNVIPPTVVAANGSITLAEFASSVTVGLGFTAQLQSLPLDLGQPTVQGQRKAVSAITARLEASLGVQAVANQVDGSILNPPEIEVEWEDLAELPDEGPGAPEYALTPYNALAEPLQTGDRRAVIGEGLSRRGQIALVQENPLPMNVLALIPEVLPGDAPQAQWPAPKGRR
jgi:hypothetical protein